MTIDIKTLVEWTEPREVNTKNGPRLLSKADATPEFWEAWRQSKDELRAAGVSCSKDDYGRWSVNWWQPIPDEIKAERAQAVEASRASAADIDLPRPEGLNYLPFQRAGIMYGSARQNVLIGDEMGLGKTIQAIGLINTCDDIESAVIVCPKSLKLNWRNELKKWLVKPLTVGIANGKGWPGTDIVILNYESLVKYHDHLRGREWGALILDEAHLIKNRETLRSAYIKGREANEKKNLEAVSPIRARRHIRLTGTPIVNKPKELHNIISDLHPDWANFFTYGKRYCNGHQKQAGRRVVWDFDGSSNLDELQRRLRETIMVRRLKADVLTELPAKVRQVIEIEPETPEALQAVQAEQQAEAEADDRLSDLRALVELAKAEGNDAYVAAMMRLDEAEELEFTKMSATRHATALSKVPYIIDHIEGLLEDNDSKVIIAAHHHDVIDGLYEGLSAYHPVKITGHENEAERQANVDAFQTDPRVRVVIGSIMAAGVGITLTASSLVIFAELDWVPGNVMQMEDRAHRIGQKNTVLIQHIVLNGSIDARMAHTLISKQEVIEAALDTLHPERVYPEYVPTPSAPRVETARRSAYEPREKVATADDTPDALTLAGEKLTPEQVTLIHSGLRILAGMDYDGARELNGVGFNKMDTYIGRALAGQGSLSPRQAALGAKLVRKYHRQLPDEINEAVRA